jgi:hypothetical protein
MRRLIMSATQMKTTLLATVLALPACAANADSLPTLTLVVGVPTEGMRMNPLRQNKSGRHALIATTIWRLNAMAG